MSADPHGIAFITCVSDPELYAETLAYLRALTVPAPCAVEFIAVESDQGIAFAYNEAMIKTKAKYKVYLHQDVFVVDRNFLRVLLDVFGSDPDIGMIGMIGAPEVPASGTWWETHDMIGKVYCSTFGRMAELSGREPRGPYEEVRLADGLLLATQYDLPWREDIIRGWHFYDASQCMEFAAAGYKIAVPAQPSPMCLHSDGVQRPGIAYELERLNFLAHYGGRLG